MVKLKFWIRKDNIYYNSIERKYLVTYKRTLFLLIHYNSYGIIQYLYHFEN
jgi:hypothetical protein